MKRQPPAPRPERPRRAPIVPLTSQALRLVVGGALQNGVVDIIKAL